MSVRILQGDCRDVLKALADNSVHCVVTSPPYFGLRDYQTGAWDGGDPACDHRKSKPSRTAASAASSTLDGGKEQTHRSHTFGQICGRCGARRIDAQIGLEPSPDAYIAKMVAVFREVRRVMRLDASLWLNLGDSFLDKQLLMMPARVALALQAEGWWLRQDIIWHKVNPMPESVTDRCTSAHEHIFMLTKAPRYYYDSVAIREDASDASKERYQYPLRRELQNSYGKTNRWSGDTRDGNTTPLYQSSRNCRNVWTIATEPYPESHFATFPAELASRCIRAGTSERGCCAACGAPWVRQVERSVAYTSGSGRAGNPPSGKYGGTEQAESGDYDIRMGPSVSSVTIGWLPSCQCNAAVVPCTVLDCFAGAFTAPMVADRLQRHAIGIELSEAYCEMARARLVKDAGMFAEIAAE